MLLDALMALSFWIATFYLFRPGAIRRSEGTTLTGWLPRLFVLNAALSLSVQVDAWAPALDRTFQINNLSWFIGYVLAAIAGYCGLAGWGRVRRYLSLPRLTIITVVILSLYLLLFPALAGDPEQLHNDFAKTWNGLVFRETSYLWLVLMANEGLGMIRRYWRHETFSTGHVRLGLLILAFRCMLVFAVLRTLISAVVYVDPSWPLVQIALLGSHLIFAACVILFALAHAPLGWLRMAARAKVYLDQQLALRELVGLRRQLINITSPLPWPLPTWRESWLQPSYALYCNLMDILDRRSMLLAAIQTGSLNKPVTPTVNRLLGELPDTSDWVELLQHVRGIAKRKRQR